MTNNNSYDKFLAVNKKRLKDLDTNIECSVSLDSDESVSKILAVNAEANCTQVEALTGEASVNGNVLISLVYVTEQGLIGNSAYTAPFSTKIADECITPVTKVVFKVCVADAKVQSLSNNTAKVDCYVKLNAFCFNNDEINYLSGASSDVCTKQEETSFETLSGMTNSSWIENLEVALKEPARKVLSCSTDVYVKDTTCAESFVSISCEVVNKIMYVTDEETPKIKSVYTKSDVKQEVECQFSTKDSKCEVNLNVNKTDVKNVINEKENEIKVSLEIPLDVCIRIFETKTVNLITDLYSVQNYTETTSSSYENTVVCEPITFEKKIEGSLTLTDEEPRIDKLLAVNYSRAVVTNEYLENGDYSLSGVISSNLIYFNEDDNNVNSVDVEIPFVVSSKTEYEGDMLTDLSVIVEDVDVMVKKGKDVYVDATLKVRSNVCKKVQGAVISELSFTEQVPQKDCAIEIYFAKVGEKIWDIAKKLFVKPEEIYSQNPMVGEVLEKDEKLAIYYQKNDLN